MTICPRCNVTALEEPKHANPRSRRDNKTYICQACSLEEVIIDAEKRTGYKVTTPGMKETENEFIASLKD